jgi:hypothetical protein
MEINNDNNCIPLHIHLKDEEEGIHKEHGYETYCEKNGEVDIDPTYPCLVPTNL